MRSNNLRVRLAPCALSLVLVLSCGTTTGPAYDTQGLTALHRLFLDRHDSEQVRQLVDAGEDELARSRAGWTIVHAAAASPSPLRAGRALHRGVDPRLRTTADFAWEGITYPAGSTALDVALMAGRSDTRLEDLRDHESRWNRPHTDRIDWYYAVRSHSRSGMRLAVEDIRRIKHRESWANSIRRLLQDVDDPRPPRY